MISIIMIIVFFIILLYLFIQLMKLSIKYNDLNYYITRQNIPITDNKNVDYIISSPAKNLS